MATTTKAGLDLLSEKLLENRAPSRFLDLIYHRSLMAERKWGVLAGASGFVTGHDGSKDPIIVVDSFLGIYACTQSTVRHQICRPPALFQIGTINHGAPLSHSKENACDMSRHSDLVSVEHRCLLVGLSVNESEKCGNCYDFFFSVCVYVLCSTSTFVSFY